jgi:glycosyltransferase involved in cell wall biosynthesis
MKFLFVHQNFPGQYLHLARHFGNQPGHQAVFITQRKDADLPEVRKIVYEPRRTITPQVHHYLRESEAAVLNAQEVARIALDLRNAGESAVARCRRPGTVSHGVAEIGLSEAAPSHSEGVDSTVARPDPTARLIISDAKVAIGAGDEVVTYVARNLEPYRGFPTFMRSLPTILAARPNARVLIVGGDEVSYGARLPAGETYKKRMLAELGGSLDLSRVHFLGKIPYNAFIEVLQVSRARVYLTYPFVLSWSMPEAMSAGCLSFGSRTQPVQEVLHRGGNRLLVDFFSPDEIAERVVEALEDRRHLQRCEAAERSAAMPGRA